MTSRIRGGKNKISRQRESTKRNNAHIEEQYVEELSTGNNSDDLSAHGNESDHMSAHENETDHPASSQEFQPLPLDELYFKKNKFTQSCKIHNKCYVSKTVKIP
ncbi:Uncharacterized protein Rs2_38450 [Raphanus sativus]|nr:Uncharacterized protein Rs2_38450 [Raphanus sativus]